MNTSLRPLLLNGKTTDINQLWVFKLLTIKACFWNIAVIAFIMVK